MKLLFSLFLFACNTAVAYPEKVSIAIGHKIVGCKQNQTCEPQHGQLNTIEFDLQQNPSNNFPNFEDKWTDSFQDGQYYIESVVLVNKFMESDTGRWFFSIIYYIYDSQGSIQSAKTAVYNMADVVPHTATYKFLDPSTQVEYSVVFDIQAATEL